MNRLARAVVRYPRVFAALLVAAAITALWIGGAHPLAVNLLRSPWDKGAHVLVFSLIAAALGRAVGLRGNRMILVAVAGTFLIGLTDEWHQASLPGRQAGWDDLAADLAGGFIGALCLHLAQASSRER